MNVNHKFPSWNDFLFLWQLIMINSCIGQSVHAYITHWLAWNDFISEISNGLQFRQFVSVCLFCILQCKHQSFSDIFQNSKPFIIIYYVRCLSYTTIYCVATTCLQDPHNHTQLLLLKQYAEIDTFIYRNKSDNYSVFWISLNNVSATVRKLLSSLPPPKQIYSKSTITSWTLFHKFHRIHKYEWSGIIYVMIE